MDLDSLEALAKQGNQTLRVSGATHSRVSLTIFDMVGTVSGFAICRMVI